MSKIQFIDMEYSYSSYYKSVFRDVNLTIDSKWKLGLVGRNGRGKTTLLKLINKDLEPSKGKIVKQVNTSIFPYVFKDRYRNTLEVIKDNAGPYFKLEEEMNSLIKDNTEESFIKYSELLNEYNDIGGFEIESLIIKEFNLMGLTTDLLERDFNSLSGGEKTKSLIIALFLRKDNFLLMDEPTNHLDIEGKHTLAKYLNKKTGFIVVSHDQDFLDQITDHILSINKMTIEIEKGNFSSWNHNRLIKEEYELRRKKHIESEVKQMEKSSKESRGFAAAKEAQKVGAGDKGFISARAARLMKRAKNIERRRSNQLEEKKDLLKNFEEIPDLKIIQSEFEEDLILKIKNLNFNYDEKEVFNEISLNVYQGDRVRITGKNGAGKTTLLNIIAGNLINYSGIIEMNENIEIAYSYQNPVWTKGYLKDKLEENKIDTEHFRNTMSYFDLGDEYFRRPLETFSNGELKKIDIAKALAISANLIILDEPLNYMDIFFREQLEKAILNYQPTIIFVEHDEKFSEKIATKIIEI